MKTKLIFRPCLIAAAAFAVSQVSGQTIEVTSTGVGIGTASPSSKLQLEKTASDTVSLANSFFFFADTPLGAGLLGQQKLTSPYAFVLQAQNQTNNAFFPISLNPAGGKVGIGTASPTAKLEVIGGSSAFGLIVEGDDSSANARIALRRGNATSATGNIDWIGNDNSVGARIGVGSRKGVRG